MLNTRKGERCQLIDVVILITHNLRKVDRCHIQPWLLNGEIGGLIRNKCSIEHAVKFINWVTYLLNNSTLYSISFSAIPKICKIMKNQIHNQSYTTNSKIKQSIIPINKTIKFLQKHKIRAQMLSI